MRRWYCHTEVMTFHVSTMRMIFGQLHATYYSPDVEQDFFILEWHEVEVTIAEVDDS